MASKVSNDHPPPIVLFYFSKSALKVRIDELEWRIGGFLNLQMLKTRSQESSTISNTIMMAIPVKSPREPPSADKNPGP